MTRELYNIYNEMFNNSFILEEKIQHSLTVQNAKVYNVEIYVGDESTRRYQLYIEYNLNGVYKNIRGLYNLEQINKMFNLH